jgi:RNA-directed DNA polymerase
LIFDNFVETLPGIPSFETFVKLDINPLGGNCKFRTCNKPNEPMSILHQRLTYYLRSLRVPLPFATGFKKGNSAVKNVKIHSNNRYFYITDIQNAFQNVKGERLALILCGLDPALIRQEKEVLAFLEKYCLNPEGGLIVGAPASPDLFNIYTAILLDLPLGYLCRKYGIIYTRYSDDLTFSSSKVRIGKRKRRAIRETIEAAGFMVHHRKSKVLDLKKGPIKINGIGLEYGGRIFLPRKYLRKINGLLERAIRKGDVNPNKIHGMMGVFIDVTGRYNLNKTEQKIVKKYRLLCRLVKMRVIEAS